MASRVAALFLLGVVCVIFVTAEVPEDCCLKTSAKRIPLQRVQSFKIQNAGEGCDIGATLFILKNERVLCFSHLSEEAWVRNYIKHLSKNRK